MPRPISRTSAGRNDPCPCGSKKKFKKCCLFEMEKMERLSKFVNEEIKREVPRPEPNIPFVPRIVANNYKWRVVNNEIHYTKPEETFHEFIIKNLKYILGKKWFDDQHALEFENRHIIMKWLRSFRELAEKGAKDPKSGRFFVAKNGSVAALLQLSYDCYCLRHIDQMEKNISRKLRDQNAYQGSRYEIAVASIFARAGFTIKYLNETVKSKKHCEFIATHKKTGIEIGVEAKSRHRPGVLNQPGPINIEEIKAAMRRQYMEAKEQAPANHPFFIFMDVNLPIKEKENFLDLPWFKEISSMLESDVNNSSAPIVYNGVIITNFSFHYFGDDPAPPKGESFIYLPGKTKSAIAESIIQEVWKSVENYASIPEEI